MIKTKPSEFVKFHKFLMSNAPKGYVPWYFPVVKENKAPDGYAVSLKAPLKHDGTKGNWKAEWARLSYEEAIKRLEQGLNVGISARSEDDLIIIDIDDLKYADQMPNTLIIKSRKRCGYPELNSVTIVIIKLNLIKGVNSNDQAIKTSIQ